MLFIQSGILVSAVFECAMGHGLVYISSVVLHMGAARRAWGVGRRQASGVIVRSGLGPGFTQPDSALIRRTTFTLNPRCRRAQKRAQSVRRHQSPKRQPM